MQRAFHAWNEERRLLMLLPSILVRDDNDDEWMAFASLPNWHASRMYVRSSKRPGNGLFQSSFSPVLCDARRRRRRIM